MSNFIFLYYQKVNKLRLLFEIIDMKNLFNLVKIVLLCFVVGLLIELGKVRGQQVVIESFFFRISKRIYIEFFYFLIAGVISLSEHILILQNL